MWPIKNKQHQLLFPNATLRLLVFATSCAFTKPKPLPPFPQHAPAHLQLRARCGLQWVKVECEKTVRDTLSKTHCNITQLWRQQQQQITAVQRRVESKTSILPQIRRITSIVGKRHDINLRIAAAPVWPLTFPNMQTQPIHGHLGLFQHNNIYTHLYIFMYTCHTFIHVPLRFILELFIIVYLTSILREILLIFYSLW